MNGGFSNYVKVRLKTIQTDYMGSALDSKLLQIDPIKSVIAWNGKLAVAGCLPDTYPDFLGLPGHFKAAAKAVKKEVYIALRRHLANMLRTYWKLTTRIVTPALTTTTSSQKP